MSVARGGNVARSRRLLAEGAELGTKFGDKALELLSAVQEARIDLVESEQHGVRGDIDRATEARERASRTIRSAKRQTVRETSGASANLLSRSVESRWALRCFERELSTSRSIKPRLLVRADGSGFRLGDAPEVTLPSASIVVGALSMLAEKRLDAPSQPVRLDEFTARCWPGHNLPPDVMSLRLRQVIKRLRRAGLASVLHRAKDGYLLDPETPVERESSESSAD